MKRSLIAAVLGAACVTGAPALESVSNEFWNTRAYVNPAPVTEPVVLETAVNTWWFSENAAELEFFSSWPVTDFLLFLR